MEREKEQSKKKKGDQYVDLLNEYCLMQYINHNKMKIE